MNALRDTLFISHANPEDNEFTLWLALQLAKEGYPVWSDLTMLLGGEDIWREAEKVIREKAVKFIYVLSKKSNNKTGPNRELKIADYIVKNENLFDFIIPALIDDLPHADINILLTGLNTIPFNISWAKGLNTLLRKLEKDTVQKNVCITAEAVTSWWWTKYSAEQGIMNEPDEYLSNWFPINALPEKIYFHELGKSGIGLFEIPTDLPYPAFQNNTYIISFAKADDFKDRLGSMFIKESRFFPTKDFLDGKTGQRLIEQKASDSVYRLLSMAWENLIKNREMSVYGLANNAWCFFFRKDQVPKDTVYFKGLDGNKADRQMIGYKTIKNSKGETKKRYWHFGIQARPLLTPYPAYLIKPHVVFSYDGTRTWDSKELTHKARRSQCKDWWNADWRDRILAAMSWLADGKGSITVPVGRDNSFEVSVRPLTFSCPVSFLDPEKVQVVEDAPEDGIDVLEEDTAEGDEE